METNKISSFLKLGNERIKFSNIKTYGISTEKAYFEKVYNIETTTQEEKFLFLNWTSINKKLVYSGNDIKMDMERFGKSQSKQYTLYRLRTAKKGDKFSSYTWGWMYTAIHSRQSTSFSVLEDGIYFSDEKATPDDFFIKELKYLYVTTYQNDNYKFYEDEIYETLEEKIDEIDKHL